MSEELLSIVTFVYNTREYVDKCISSILNQTYRNLELILVVNGPTDGSDEICRRYAEMDKRIKLITFEKNRRGPFALSDVLKEVSGKYLGFVDSDDYLDPDMYQQLMDCKEDYDLVISRWKREEGDKTRMRCDPLAVGSYKTEEDMEFIFEHLFSRVEPGGGEYIRPGIAVFTWNKLYKTSLYKGICEKAVENSDEKIVGKREMFSDLVYCWLYVSACKSVLITDICGYHYRIRKTSTSHRVLDFDRHMADIQSVYRTMEPVFMVHPRCDILMPLLQREMARLFNRVPRRVGFCKEAQNQTFVFPFFNMLDGQHIALYGAGELGQSYWRQIRRHSMCDVDLWVDEKWAYHCREGWDVSPTEALLSGTYDYVVIAAEQQDMADKIRKNLITMGVAEDKLLWKAPVEII